LPASLPTLNNGAGDGIHDLNISDNYQSVGSFGAYHPHAYLKLYTQTLNGQPHVLQVTTVSVYDTNANCGANSNTGIRWDVYNIGPAENQFDSKVSDGWDIRAKGCGTFSITIPDSAFSLSDKTVNPDGTKIYTAALDIWTPTAQFDQPSHSYFFTIGRLSSAPDVRLGFLSSVGNGTIIYPEKNYTYSSNYDGLNTVSMPFRPSCTLDGGSSVRWGDDDYNSPNQPHGAGMSLHLLVYDAATGAPDPSFGNNGDITIAVDNTNNTSIFSGGDLGAESQYQPPGGWKAGKKYIFQFRHVVGGNGIWIKAPFDSGDFDIGCPPTVNNTQNNAQCFTTTASDSGDWLGYPAYTQVDINGNQAVNGINGQVNRGQPATKTWNYVPNGQTVTVSKTRYAYTPDPGGTTKSWKQVISTPDAPNPDVQTFSCFHATCSIDGGSAVGDGPNGLIVAGGQFTVRVNLLNDGPNNLTEGYYFTGWHLGISGNGGEHNLNYGLVEGSSGGIFVTLTAPTGGPQNFNVSFTPNYNGGGFTLGDTCSGNIAVYAPFTLTPHATSAPGSGATEEDLTAVDYSTYVDNSYSGNVDATTTYSKFYKQPSTIFAQDSRNTLGGGRTTTLSGTKDLSGTPIVAGDSYCAYISLPYTSGYVGPGGSVTGQTNDPSKNPAEQCVTVTNKPTFKAYNSGVQAGGDVNACSSNGGTLAGWNNYNASNGYNYGSGSQLSALALIKITGVASAQSTASSPFTPPDNLSFANKNNGLSGMLATSGDSVLTGGGFGTDVCMFVPTPAPTGSLNAAGDTVVPANSKITISVPGDVYIAGNVLYQGDNSGATGRDASWTDYTRIPAVYVHAGGNIYISKDATELDGLYVAGGKIYDCATGAGAPVSAANMYGQCNKQLTVYGSFIAKQVNLMRTYGSLRDEKPVGATVPANLLWSCGGGSCNPSLSGYTCTSTNEPWEPASNTWNDNNLCIPAGSPYHIKFSYISLADAKNYGSGITLNNCTNSWGSVVNPAGVPSTGAGPPSGTNRGWDNNYFCSDFPGNPITFQASNDASRDCTKILESADSEGNGIWQKVYVCVDKANPGGPRTIGATSCSNPGSGQSIRSGTVPQGNCAAEVFDFTPEFYLSNPNVELGPKGTQYQAITSLPPVL
jgi:hypothetical protein